MKRLLFVLLMVAGCASLLAAPTRALADETQLSANSWDPGLTATTATYNNSVHAWGTRRTAGAWGTGPVNYISGATANNRAGSSGVLTVRLNGTYCPAGNCSYGGGTGYKALVQFWNDPSDYIAFGLINDPGVSPSGTTLMIEGAAQGRPVGGYWPRGAISGTSHLFTFTWSASGISVTIDNQVSLGPYPVTENNPSISFLAAGRQTGDSTDSTFTNISFSHGSVVAQPVSIPPGSPYLDFSSTVNEGGTGTGYSAYINAHDANSNAVSIGIQTDSGSPESAGQPYYIWEVVQNGKFTFDYLSPASPGSHLIDLRWWPANSTAVFYVDSNPIADIQVNLNPRLFVQVEGDARLNSDTVNDTFTNTTASTIGNQCPTYCGLNGSWNTSFSAYGLHATNTNGQPQNGANFTVTGTVSGLPPGGDWDNHLVYGIAMIAQYWNGQ